MANAMASCCNYWIEQSPVSSLNVERLGIIDCFGKIGTNRYLVILSSLTSYIEFNVFFCQKQDFHFSNIFSWCEVLTFVTEYLGLLEMGILSADFCKFFELLKMKSTA